MEGYTGIWVPGNMNMKNMILGNTSLGICDSGIHNHENHDAMKQTGSVGFSRTIINISSNCKLQNQPTKLIKVQKMSHKNTTKTLVAYGNSHLACM